MIKHNDNADYTGKSFIDMTDNNGTSWSSLCAGLDLRSDYWFSVFEVSPHNVENIYVGGVYLYKITPPSSITPIAATWESGTHDDARALQILGYNSTANTETLLLGDDGGVAIGYYHNWQSINGTGQVNNRLNITQIYGLGITDMDNGKIIGGSQDNGIFLLNQSELTDWINYGVGDGGICRIDPKRRDTMYGTGNNLLYRTFNGINFNGYSLPEGGNWRVGMPFEIDPNNTGNIYFGKNNLWKSADRGENWTQITNLGNKGWLSAIEIAPNSNSQIIYIADNNKTWGNSAPEKNIFRSDNGGITWTDITHLPNNNAILNGSSITDITTDPKDPKRVWITIDGISNNGSAGTYNGSNRVFYSWNGGEPYNGTDTWVDVSTGLTALPANTIVYQEGTNDLLYVGTDVGVFYWDGSESSPSWKCYSSEGFPVTIISELKINNCEKKLIASTFGRCIWQSDLYNVNEHPVEITSNTTWNNDRLLMSDLTITTGNILNISGCKIKIDQNNKIIIEPGAKLIIDNGVLTNQCSSLWQGIELRGDGNESQLTQGEQGEVEIINGGTIENALCGIYVGERDGNGNLLPNTGGGIVKATGGVFKNCVEAVHYTPYINFNPNYQNHPEIINTGYFTDCTFETDDDYYSMTVVLPKSFITLNGIKGLRLKGNTFQNTSDDARPAQERGKGITSIDAMYYLYPACTTSTYPCPQPDPNKFEKLHYGIYAANIKPLIPIFVKDNDFTDNFNI